MGKLMKLEWKKNRGAKYIGKAAAMTAIIFLLVTAMSGELGSQETIEVYGKSMQDATIQLFANMCFMLLTSVMLSNFIVAAYRDKTMALMFSYPIKRRKILCSKMLAVWGFNFMALVICKLFCNAGFWLANTLTHGEFFGSFGPEMFMDASFYADTLINSAAMVSITYVVLPVGLKVKSSKATIVAAFIVIMLTQGNIGSYTLFNNMLFYAALLVCAAVSVFLCVYRVETEDVG